ncbi:hypothetical protein pipiens_017583, partial [Culex pipiens pipiens]
MKIKTSKVPSLIS